MTHQTANLTWWTRIGYGMGDVFGGGSGVLVSLYYLIFLTDVVRLPPAWAGAVILLSKLYDSLTDPLEGLITDRTRTPWGRRRPYLLVGIPLVFLAIVALYYPHNQTTPEARFVAALGGYVFFSTVTGLVGITYNALHAEITLDYHERAALSSIRIVFSMLGAMLAAWLPLEIIRAFPDVRAGYTAMSLALGALLAVPLGLTVWVVRERSEFQRAMPPVTWRALWLEPLHNRAFRCALVMYGAAFVALDIISAIVVYFATHHLGRVGDVTGINLMFVSAQVLALPAYVGLSRRWGKARTYTLGLALCGLALGASPLLGPETPQGWVYGFAAVLGAGASGLIVMMYAIFPDIPDVDELLTGQRREAAFAALVSLARKFSSALALFGVGLVVQAAGYVPPLHETFEGVTRLVEQPQPASFVLALRVMLALGPMLLLLVAGWAAWHFPLTPHLHQQVQAVLARQRAGQPVDQAERQALLRVLVDTNALKKE